MTTKQSPQAKNLVVSPDAGSQGRRSNRGAFQRGFVLPSPTLIMAGVIIALSLSNLLFIKLWQGAKDDFVTFRAEVQAAQEQTRIDNERKLAELESVNRRLESGWDSARAALRVAPVIRVRSNSCAGAVSGVSAPTSVPNETPAADTISAEQCEAYLHDGIQDAAQVMWLQEWIKQAVEATK